MATKTAQIIIDVDDKSIIELNQEIKKLETSMQGLKVGTQEWQKANKQIGVLKTQYQQVTREAVKMQAVTEKITGQEAVRSVAKLGAGMVGAFATASGSLKMLGIQSDTFDEMTAKAATLMSMMGGLNQISELFSKDTLKGLKGLGMGFKGLATTVQGASVGMKAALISTGIGALVVGVGLLIANFDKIKNMFNGAAKEQAKIAAQQLAQAQNLATVATEDLKERQAVVELAKKESEYSNETVKLRKAESDLATAQLVTNRVLQQEQVALIDSKNFEIDKAKKADLEKLKSEKVKMAATLLVLRAEEKVLELNAKQAIVNTEISKQVDNVNKKIVANKLRQVEITKELYNQEESYKLQRKELELQATLISGNVDSEGKMTTEANNQFTILNAQIDALDAQEKERVKQLTIELKSLEYERSIQNLLVQTQNIYKEITMGLTEQQNALESNTQAYELQLVAISKIQKDYDALVKKRQEIKNFDEKGMEMYAKENDELIKQLDGYSQIFDETKQILLTKIDSDKINDKALEKGAEELALYSALQSKTKEKLENDIRIAEKKKEIVLWQKKETEALQASLNNQKVYYQKLLDAAQLKLDGAKNDEERKATLEEVQKYEGKINEISTQTLDNKKAIVDADNEILGLNQEIQKSNEAIDKTVEDTADKQKEVTAEIEKQSRLSQEMQNFVAKYGEEIQAVQQALGQSMEFIATLFDNKAKKMQKRIDAAQEEMDNLMQQEEDRKDRLLDYEKLLEDANGARYDEILAKINEEKAAHAQAAIDYAAEDAIRLKAIADRNKAEKRAAQFRKAAAIIDAIIAGALAVVKALPNVFLAVAVGVLSAAAVGTIIAQKIPDPPSEEVAKPLPKMAKGGTSKGSVTLVGEEGPELVQLPAGARVYSNPDSMRMLAGGYVGAYAQGGTIPALNSGGQSLIDYEKMALAFLGAVQGLPAPQVSVLKITQEQNNVALTKKNAGLSRN